MCALDAGRDPIALILRLKGAMKLIESPSMPNCGGRSTG